MQHFCFLLTFFTSWSKILKIFLMNTKDLCLSGFEHKFVIICLSEHVSFAKIIHPYILCLSLYIALHVHSRCCILLEMGQLVYIHMWELGEKSFSSSVHWNSKGDICLWLGIQTVFPLPWYWRANLLQCPTFHLPFPRLIWPRNLCLRGRDLAAL